ncbi:MAG TPA: DUF89 family protein [Candidatus Mediterraneibacter tabaqchaliae]|uniref:DUF89 family protein n=1 Tax=Candidatus Mediterraneibacter tabaqchaliae TaxID=2838689 RepID=A0A9D2R3K2_9FIRM|nr:DUF89 family protein [Candidatus Mediterraneibacter tabaqchaliae]
MRINSFCLTCLIQMQEAQIHDFQDEEKKMRFMREVLSFLSSCDRELSAPALVKPLSEIYERYWGKAESMEHTKKTFNDFLLSMEEDLETQIRGYKDPLGAALRFARTGNYIDYASVRDLSEEGLMELFEKQSGDELDETEYSQFRRELHSAAKLIYLTDNCGEIVLDKIAVRILREQYPLLNVKVIVRGAPVVNDADMDAAEYVGLDRAAQVMSNGSAIAGTDLADISEMARKEIETADLIIAKGQGNFETLHGCGLNIYYLFLCKCSWFMKKFHAERMQGMFVNERRIPR